MRPIRWHGRGAYIFQSHMWDGSTVPLKENLDIAEELLDKSQKAHTVLRNRNQRGRR